jgi:TRAP-type C4-dicarboxylate transport system substrate-binding protein
VSLRRLSRASIALALALHAVTAPASAASDAAPLAMTCASGPALPLGRAAERWAQRIGEDAGGRLVVRLHPGATLSGRDPARELFALKDGKADLGVGSALQWSLQVPALAVFSLPWFAPSERALAALAGDAALVDALASRLAATGVTLLATAPLGHRGIATLARPVRAPADLQGLRIRATPSPLMQELLLALGAAPHSMPFREAQAAFARGALDGQEGSASALALARAGAAGHRHVTDWHAVGDALLFVVRTPVWERLDQAQRELLRRTARAAVEDAGPSGRDAAALRQMAENGVAIVRLTPAGHAAFRAAAASVEARWHEAVGADVIALAQRALASQR